MTRRLALIPVMGMLLLVMVAATPAAARLQEGLKISKDTGEVSRDYPGMAGSSNAFYWSASGCKNPAMMHCDTIPLTIVPPQLDQPSNEWLIEVELSWDDPEADLDLYIWDTGQTRRDDGDPDTNGDQRINQSAGSSNPEKVLLYEPFSELQIVTHLFYGVNLEYTVTVRYQELEFGKPFEALAPEFTATGPGDGGEFTDNSAWSPAPVDYSAVPDDFVAAAAPEFGEIAIETDDDFTEFGASDFDREISAPAIPAGTRRLVAPPGEVPGIVAFFWLGLVPLMVLVLGAFLVIRRSRNAMAFA